jgi:hypothetical protein
MRHWGITKGAYIDLLRRDGNITLVGAPEKHLRHDRRARRIAVWVAIGIRRGRWLAGCRGAVGGDGSARRIAVLVVLASRICALLAGRSFVGCAAG